MNYNNIAKQIIQCVGGEREYYWGNALCNKITFEFD